MANRQTKQKIKNKLFITKTRPEKRKKKCLPLAHLRLFGDLGKKADSQHYHHLTNFEMNYLRKAMQLVTSLRLQHLGTVGNFQFSLKINILCLGIIILKVQKGPGI